MQRIERHLVIAEIRKEENVESDTLEWDDEYDTFNFGPILNSTKKYIGETSSDFDHDSFEKYNENIESNTPLHLRYQLTFLRFIDSDENFKDMC